MPCWFSGWRITLSKFGLWATVCEYFWKAILCIFLLWLTGCEQHWRFWWMAVSSHLSMTDREWVIFHSLWKAVSSHLFLWPTGSEWNCTFCERQPHHISYDQQGVSDILHSMKCSLITSFPMTSLWVTLHILWKVVSSHLFLWPTVCEWHCAFCERQSHHIFSYDHSLCVTLHIL